MQTNLKLVLDCYYSNEGVAYFFSEKVYQVKRLSMCTENLNDFHKSCAIAVHLLCYIYTSFLENTFNWINTSFLFRLYVTDIHT